jgi:hypothetical protein
MWWNYPLMPLFKRLQKPSIEFVFMPSALTYSKL